MLSAHAHQAYTFHILQACIVKPALRRPQVSALTFGLCGDEHYITFPLAANQPKGMQMMS